MLIQVTNVSLVTMRGYNMQNERKSWWTGPDVGVIFDFVNGVFILNSIIFKYSQLQYFQIQYELC